MIEEGFCSLCINGKCVLKIDNYPKEANISECKNWKNRRDIGLINTHKI